MSTSSTSSPTPSISTARHARRHQLLRALTIPLVLALLLSANQRRALAQVIDPGEGVTSYFLPLVGSGSQAPPVQNTPVVQAATARARFSLINLKSGPGDSFPRSGEITPAEACPIRGQNPEGTHWLLDCPSGNRGWIDGRFVTVSGSTRDVPTLQTTIATATATVTPSPTPFAPTATPVPPPSPTPNPTLGWRASFYNNASLSGDPLVVDDLPDINLSWGAGSPYPGIGADNFSARFERRFSLASGQHRFTLRADDGVRFWLNNQLLIDGWGSASGEPYSLGLPLTGGAYDLRVEYLEQSGDASLQFTYEFLGPEADWQADYFNNASFSGAPVRSQAEASRRIPLELNVGQGSPLPQPTLGGAWSARWQGSFYFPAGDYSFEARATGGVRVYIDGLPILDDRSPGQKTIRNTFRSVGEGNHTIRVEYTHESGPAALRVRWSPTVSGPIPF